MVRRVSARQLLREAKAIYDDPNTRLAPAANQAWKWGFMSGAEWMRLVLGRVRGNLPVGSTKACNLLGTFKYGLASTGALACVGTAVALQQPIVLLLVVPVFYGIEAQMVFLFPLILDGTPSPWRAARMLTVRAGGTLTVMQTVLPLAAVMLFGGFLGQGFLRSWCLGCVAVCLWYERVRFETVATAPEAKSA
jgi:hypothetical protein